MGRQEGWLGGCCCAVDAKGEEGGPPQPVAAEGSTEFCSDDEGGVWEEAPIDDFVRGEEARLSASSGARAALAEAGAVLESAPAVCCVDDAAAAPADSRRPGIWEAVAAAPPPASRSLGGVVVIMLVNPKSGGNAAGRLLRLPRAGLLFDNPGARATVFSYPIADPERLGICHLAEEVRASPDGEPVRCIVAGGDGTVMWAIQEIFFAGIPVDRVVVGIIPFGTGNDFGNATRWGTTSPPGDFLQEEKRFQGLSKYVREWLRADTLPYDIWEFSVRTRESEKARFEFIEQGRKACTADHIERHGIQRLPGGDLEMSKYVCNYVGLGLDARVGFGFDKLRQRSRSMNKAIYVWEGFKKMMFKKKGVVAHIVESMQVLDAGDGPSRQARELHGEDAPAASDVFSTEAAAVKAGTPKLLGNPVSLLFLNIPSIAGGLDIWRWSARKVGTNLAVKSLLSARQDFGDGRLECISYRTGAGFYLEQARAPPISGQGNRIFSGEGPLRINFRDPSHREYRRGTSHCKGRVYMQVDGEFFCVHEPRSVVLKHHATIRVLVKSDEVQSCC